MYSQERKCDKMSQITQLSEDPQHSFNVSVPYPERQNLHISDDPKQGDSAQENCEDDLGYTTLEVILVVLGSRVQSHYQDPPLSLGVVVNHMVRLYTRRLSLDVHPVE